MVEIGRTRELGALVELYRELVKVGVVNVTLSDARPAVSVRMPQTSPAVRIEVDPADGMFVWRRDDRERHPLDDPEGAAGRLAEFFTARETDHGIRQ